MYTPLRYDENVGTSDDDEPEVEILEVHDGRETLLPSLTRSVLSGTKSRGGSETPAPTAATPHSADRPRGARTGDVVGGRYVVDGQLGRGGMGRVLRVRHQALGKPFALKLIKSAIATNPKIRELFYREARLASSLTHENICSIVDFGQDDVFGLFMVMELLEGNTVHHKLRFGGRLPPKVACDVMWQVADALRFIHGRQILHGDIKTENIFLVKSTVQRRLVKLLDFGLARADLGRDDLLDGTPEYLAPERIAGAPASQASDIYALGIVFFELLTATQPFHGDYESVLQQQRNVPVPAPSKLLDEPLDDRADQIVARATAKDPAQRHPDMAAFMYELRTLMGMLGIDVGSRPSRPRRALAAESARFRRELDHVGKAAAEVFAAAPLPMASCSVAGRVRAANAAFREFLGVADSAGDGLDLSDTALPEVYPTLLADLAEVGAKRLPVKRVLYLNEGGDHVVEAAVVLSPAPASADATAGEVHIVIHPLRSVAS